jgi:chemotaxis methyl-accepting protein methylase
MSDSTVVPISRFKVLRKCLGTPFLRVNEWAWNALPSSWRAFRPISSYGSFLHSLVRQKMARTQFHGTFFLRNRPELELLRSLADQKPRNATVKVAVLACSNGAEVYSIVWKIRSARPDLRLEVHAMDISEEIVKIARKGVYSLGENPLIHSPMMERLNEDEMAALFDREGDQVRIKPWIAEGIHWGVGDAGDPALSESLGFQDIVVANKFLCHMAPPDAEKCLRALARLVRPGGYLFVSGLDLDIRAKVATDLGWTPVPDLIEEVHDGDPSVRRDWPWKYWGLEPFNAKRPDWKTRYAAVFQLGLQKEAREAICVHN